MYSKTRISRWFMTAIVAGLAITSFLFQQAPPVEAGVMMQGFYSNVPSGYGNNWWWDNLASKSSQLAQAGFTVVWIPPSLKGASGGYSSGYDPFDDYDLGSKNQKGTIPTHYGTRLQLERACAVMHANGLQVYADIVDNHRDGDDGNYNFSYVDAYGNASGGRFGKGYYDFHPNVPQDPNVPDGNNEFTFGRDLAPVNGGQTTINGQTWVWDDYNLKQALDWQTKALDLNGYRFDYVRGISWTWLGSLLNYGAMSGKFAVGENWTGNVGDLNNWVTNNMQNRSSAFDFPLHDSYLVPMCNNPGSFNMASLDHAGLVGVNPGGAVTFVENHDTDGNNPITQNKLMAYAYILTSEGYPCVFYRDWSTDPGCYGAGLQSGIDNLIWIHEKIAAGDTIQRWENNQIFTFERRGWEVSKPDLLVAMNSGSNSYTITCQTDFSPNTQLHDYTGHAPDIWTNNNSQVTITIPANNGGTGYCCYSVTGIGGSFTPANNATTQEYAGAQDLDIKPADNTQYITAAQVEVNAGSNINGTLYYDTNTWNSNTSISVQLLDPSGSTVATQAFDSNGNGASLNATASRTGLYTLQVRSYNTPSTNLKPAYWLRATYTAPQTIIPATFTVTNAGTSGSQQVYVVGNVTELGNWSPANGFLLNNNGNGTWSGEVGLPPSTALQYKYVKWDGANAVWESNQTTASGNREVTTPASGSIAYNDGSFYIVHPAPSVSNLSPATAPAGTNGVTMTVAGSGFDSSSVVNWNGVAVLTTFLNTTTLSAAVPQSDLATAGTAQVTVVNPSPGGGTSGSMPFTVTQASPTLKLSITQLSKGAGSLSTTVSIANTGTASATNLHITGAQLTYLVGGKMTTVNASSITQPATSLAVGGSTTSAATFSAAPATGSKIAIKFTVVSDQVSTTPSLTATAP